MARVLISSRSKPSTTRSAPSAAWRSARRAARRGASWPASSARSCADAARRPRRRRPSAEPSSVPWRARPVPFWRHGFLPPPLTSPRVSVFGGAEAPAGQLADHGLVDERLVDRRAEERLGQVHRAGLLAVGLEDRRLRHRHFAFRTSSRPLRAPGTAPLTRMRLRSASTLHDLELLDGHLLVAHVARPCAALPDAARVGAGADGAGRRWWSEPWVFGPRRKLWRAMTPVKPWPLLTPVTSTSSPASNRSTPSCWPTS